MNSLFTCSWAKNVSPINEQAWINEANQLLTEEGGKRGKTAAPEYARLMGLSDVRKLAGTMTPRYFATKVIRQLAKDHPGVQISDVSDEDLLKAMNLVANLSRKLATKGDIQLSTTKLSDVPSSKERVKMGGNAFETLNLNLTPETKFEFDKETPMGYHLFKTSNDGLNYNVTIKTDSVKPFALKDLEPGSVASLQVTEPSKKETVSLPAADEGSAPKIEREKLVADFPPGGAGDFEGPDPEDVAHGRESEDAEDEAPMLGDFTASGVMSSCCQAPVLPGQICSACNDHCDVEPSDVPDLFDPNKGLVDDEEEENSPAPTAPQYTDPVKPEEDCEMTVGKVHMKNPSPDHLKVALTKEQKDKMMREAYRARLQSYHRTERRNTLGY